MTSNGDDRTEEDGGGNGGGNGHVSEVNTSKDFRDVKAFEQRIRST